MTDFHLADVIARVTERRLRDPDFWRQQGIPIPARYVEGEITIPKFLLVRWHGYCPVTPPDLTRIDHADRD